jgi:hypothetical protein
MGCTNFRNNYGSGSAALVDISNNVARCFHRKKCSQQKVHTPQLNLFYNLEK